MNKKYRVGIVGATGAVGQELIGLLFARNFPMSSLTLLASSRSAGKKISHGSQTFTVEEAKPESFENLDMLNRTLERNTQLNTENAELKTSVELLKKRVAELENML